MSGRPRSRLYAVAISAAVVAVFASASSALLLTSGAQAGRDTAVSADRAADRARLVARVARDAERAPLARGGRCSSPRPIVGVGRACRTGDGLLLLPRPGGAVTTHGPDLASTTRTLARAGGFGTQASIFCSAPGSTRHVLLAYLIPVDYAAGTSEVHGDRYTEVAPQLRQALYDAAALMDRRAGELVPGARRRLRVACEPDGTPTVERIVLPRTAVGYRVDRDGGFGGLIADLETLGWLPTYRDHVRQLVPSVRRVLGYYDAEFEEGIVGQGVMFRRSSMLAQGAAPNDPLVSRTARNINNNPPQASLAVQYATGINGVPQPPLYTSLLHELLHTMGAVQDDVPTSSGGGHCNDGLDLMCYDDGGARSSYVESTCPDATAPVTPDDELLDCNADTYFHPAPPRGNPLAGAVVWSTGLAANQVLATSTAGPPGAIGPLTVTGRGTSIVLAWPATRGARGYDVAWRPVGGSWQRAEVVGSTTTFEPVLLPRTDYDLAVAAFDVHRVVGAASTIARRTGIDTSPPSRPGSFVALNAGSTSARLRLDPATDNVGVVRYRVERLDARRWRVLGTFAAPASTASPVTGARFSFVGARAVRGSGLRLRLRAIDARGNVSPPGPSTLVVPA
jgi:hypothetical protein